MSILTSNRSWLFLALSVLILGVFLGGCAPKSKTKSGKLNVVCTTGMVGDLAKSIGGDHITVTTLMGPGIDPHLYRASAGTVKVLSNADVIFYNGLHLEAKMGEIFEKLNQRITTVAVTRDIPETLLRSPKEFKGFHDPHVWFDVSMWAMTVNVVRDTLIEKDPAHKADYLKRAADYRSTLLKLHAEVSASVAILPQSQRILITAHDAFGYFGQAYGFDVMGLQGISTESEAGAKDVQRLAQIIADRKVNALFVESSVPKRNIEAVQAAVKSRNWDTKIGGQLFSDAMGNPGTPEGTYIGMVRFNVKTIVTALQGSPQ